MKPTYEELEAKLRDTEARLQRAEVLLKAAIEKIAQLEARLNRNSTNRILRSKGIRLFN